LYLKDTPCPSGEKIQNVRGIELPIIDFNFKIVMSCNIDEMDVVMKLVPGRNLVHWVDCLEIGKNSVVTAVKFTYRDMAWYMPKIDGYVPGLFGKVKS
jgi:hypothetical protein